jgi:hypothetical protein
VTASHRVVWKTAAYIDTKVNAVAPKSPASGSDWIRHEIATHADPRQTHNRDSNALGQRERSHNADIAQQHTATTTARTSLRVPCGPVGLQISVTEMALNPNMTSATRRHVDC